MVDMIHQLRKWVEYRGLSDHLPIFMEVNIGPTQPPTPLKFNQTWLNDESFLLLISGSWIPFNPRSLSSTAFQFAAHFKRLKAAIKE